MDFVYCVLFASLIFFAVGMGKSSSAKQIRAKNEEEEIRIDKKRKEVDSIVQGKLDDCQKQCDKLLADAMAKRDKVNESIRKSEEELSTKIEAFRKEVAEKEDTKNKSDKEILIDTLFEIRKSRSENAELIEKQNQIIDDQVTALAVLEDNVKQQINDSWSGLAEVVNESLKGIDNSLSNISSDIRYYSSDLDSSDIENAVERVLDSYTFSSKMDSLKDDIVYRITNHY